MNDIDALGKQLRAELGEPPPDWEEKQWRRLQEEHLEAPPRPRRFSLGVAAFALAGVVLLLGYWIGADFETTVATETGTTNEWLEATSSDVEYRAPDGSTIRLDAGGRGRFSADLRASEFELQRGSGTFQVTKRPGQDWTVLAGRYSIHVVGTRFGVSYDEGDLGVWVEEGRVSVRMPQRADPVLLDAGQKLNVRGERLTQKQSDEAADSGAEQNAAAATEPAAAGQEADDSSSSGAERVRSTAPTLPDWHALYVRGEYAQSLAAARQVGFQRLTRSLSAQRLVDLAAAARLGGDSQAALDALQVLERRFPGSAAALDVDFLIGRIHAQHGASNAAIRRLTSYLERGDAARYSLEALGRLIELHAGNGDVSKARPLAQRYLERAPKGAYRHLAESVLRRR